MNNKGITLMVLIITIIVMLIIAGVVINSTIGNNSIITLAEKSKYKNSISQIEQKLNEIYNQNYEEIENLNLKVSDAPASKARGLAYYLESKYNDDNIFRPAKPNGKNYTYHIFSDDKFAYVSSEGKMFYMLSPQKLRIWNSSLEILNLREPDSRKSRSDIQRIYAVTSDLRVFIIDDSLDNLTGLKKEELDTYNWSYKIKFTNFFNC